VQVTNKTLNKGAHFSDIHFGRKANSQQHNQDCVNFIEWFCSNVRKDPEIDHVVFLGDWNENRSALNISTLNYSYRAAKMLNDLGLPIFFIIGNHDLYHRHTREIHSVIPFSEFDNFQLIDEPTVIDNIGKDGALLCPYLFHEEYTNLVKYLNIPYWAGHFEFKGFEVTGYGMKMPTGPDAEDFTGPDFIVSGHFHKRQADGNVVYIGNTFPMDFGDTDSNDRGMMVFDHTSQHMEFFDWQECPKYTKTRLSDLLDGSTILYPDSRVKCVVDIPVTFEESTFLRQKYTEDYLLREFTLEESMDIKEVLSQTNVDVDWDDEKLAGVDELVQEMLKGIDSEHISNNTLIDIYSKLPLKNKKEKGND